MVRMNRLVGMTSGFVFNPHTWCMWRLHILAVVNALKTGYFKRPEIDAYGLSNFRGIKLIEVEFSPAL